MTPKRHTDRAATVLRLYTVAFAAALPCTAALLAAVHALARYSPNPDVAGLTAVSVGIVGVLLFFIFLYKIDVHTVPRRVRPVARFAAHAGAVLVLFCLVVWLGFASPWRLLPLWGSYDFETCSRSWIIAVIVVGSISLLGAVIEVLRRTAHAEEDEADDGLPAGRGD